MAATTTTVTFGLLAGGGLAAAAAVAGALGLGLAALALKSRRHRKVHHVHHGGGHSGYGGGHGSYGDHGGGYGHRRADKATRKRRAIDSTNASENENEDDNDWKKAKEREEILMEVVRAEDASGCGMKLVCQLASMNEGELSEEQQAVLDFVGPAVAPGESLWSPTHRTPVTSRAKLEYKVARGLGELGYPCESAYPTCPVNNVPALLNSMLP